MRKGVLQCDFLSGVSGQVGARPMKAQFNKDGQCPNWGK